MNKVEEFLDIWSDIHTDDDSPEHWREVARVVSFEMHKGQTDKGGQPYFNHPLAIAKTMENLGFSLERQTVAYLHDVVEDIPEANFEFLRTLGFSEKIIDAVNAITHRNNESYGDYVIRVSKNPIAKDVKLFDLKHNASLDRVLYDPRTMENDIHRLAKYVISHRFLSGIMDEQEFLRELVEIGYFLLG